MKNFKILITNLQYGIGIDGSAKDWLLKGHRVFHLPKKIEKIFLDKFKKIIQEENPDLICINEIKKNQIIKLMNKKYQYHNTETKYGPEGNLRKRIPFHKHNCNATLSKHNLKIEKKFLKNGNKKLFYEINLPNNIKLSFFHFSLNKRTRQKQFQEIYELYKHHPSKIICGDFNIIYGFKELDRLIKKLDLKRAHQNPNFPASRPSRSFDLVLHSPHLQIKSKILPDIFSDHLAILIEIQV